MWVQLSPLHLLWPLLQDVEQQGAQKDKNLGFLQGETRDPRHKLSEQHGLVTTRPSQFLLHRWDCEAQRGNSTSQTSHSNRLG